MTKIDFNDLLYKVKNITDEKIGVSKLSEIKVVGVAGGGSVSVEINGNFECLKCTIDENITNKKVLEDLLVNAFNNATQKLLTQLGSNVNGFSNIIEGFYKNFASLGEDKDNDNK